MSELLFDVLAFITSVIVAVAIVVSGIALVLLWIGKDVDEQ